MFDFASTIHDKSDLEAQEIASKKMKRSSWAKRFSDSCGSMSHLGVGPYVLRNPGAPRILTSPEPSKWENQPLSVYVPESYENFDGKAQPDENAPSAR